METCLTSASMFSYNIWKNLNSLVFIATVQMSFPSKNTSQFSELNKILSGFFIPLCFFSSSKSTTTSATQELLKLISNISSLRYSINNTSFNISVSIYILKRSIQSLLDKKIFGFQIILSIANKSFLRKSFLPSKNISFHRSKLMVLMLSRV